MWQTICTHRSMAWFVRGFAVTRSHFWKDVSCVSVLWAFATAPWLVYGGVVASAASTVSSEKLANAQLGAAARSSDTLRIWDRTSGKMWGVITDCRHPERPSRMLPLDAIRISQGEATPSHEIQSNCSNSSAIVVNAGDEIDLWSSDGNSHVQLRGISEQAGSLGQRIRVRCLLRQSSGASMTQILFGIVRGPSSVEIQPRIQ